MTQKAWNLNYRDANGVNPCWQCDKIHSVPFNWCDEVGMQVESGKTCLNFSGTRHAAAMTKAGTKGT